MKTISWKTRGEVRAAQRRLPFDRAVAAVCAVVAVGLTSVLTRHYGMGFTEQGKFWLTLAGTIVLPGLFIVRRFPVGALLPRLGAAFVAGLGGQLLGWFVAVRTGQHLLLWIVPWVVAGAWFLLDRRLLPPEQHLQTGEATEGREAGSLSSPVPWWGSIVLLAVWVVVLFSLERSVWATSSITGTPGWYQDLYWHVSITADATNFAPPTDPQAAFEGVLSYHWFSNAHAAALTMASGLDLNKISVLAWYLPVMAATLALTYGFAVRLSRSSAAGALAAVLLVAAPSAAPLAGLNMSAHSALVWMSPSHIFSLPVALLVTWAVIELLRSKRPAPWLWVFTGYLFLISPGAKVSLLPTILGGVSVVGLVAIIRRKDILRPLLIGILGVLIVLATRGIFAGGGDGSKLGFGAVTEGVKLFGSTATSSPPEGLLLVGLVIALAGTFLSSMIVVAAGSGDRDPAPLVYAGMMAVALVAIFGLSHPSLSQLYFMRGIIPVSAVFIAWGCVAAVRKLFAWLPHERALGAAVASVVVGGGVGYVWVSSASFSTPPGRRWLVLAVVVFLLLAALMALAVSSRRRLAVTALCVGLAVVAYSVVPSVLIASPFKRANPPPATSGQAVPSPAEVAAAKALAAANPDGALIATNVHCLRPPTKPHCDARGFWVSALTRSPVLIGAWAYTADARGRNLVDGYFYYWQSFGDPAEFALNESAFTDPTPQTIAALKAKGVRYLYADSRAGQVSPNLAQLTEVIWSSGGVAVFRIR